MTGFALTAFRGCHAGEPIVVCGCGTSLKTLHEPQRHVTIGVNDVGRLFDPTYLVVINPPSQLKDGRFQFVKESNARALFTQLELGSVRPPVVRFRLGQYGGTEIGADGVLHYTQNSPYVAACLAAYMGARRIGLVGVDLTDDHFFARTGRHSLATRLREIDAQYGRLAAALARRGVELVNLSTTSRLNSLPRVRIEPDGRWTPVAGPIPPVSDDPPRPELGSTHMRIAVDKRSGGPLGAFLDALATTAARLGHTVGRNTRALAHDPRVLSVVWNGRAHQGRGPTLYCEHGWLPRSDYQVSPRGINAASHVAPFLWNGEPLPPAHEEALDEHLKAIKSTSFAGYYQYMQAQVTAATDVPAAFLLVPLQIEADTNLLHFAPTHLRTMQALVDYLSKVNPPWPILFKQHPADLRRGNRQLRLRLRRGQDMLWPHARGNVHQMLKSGACRGIVTINSNVAHDGLLWDVPAVVLGRNVWPPTGEQTPFLVSIPRDWKALDQSVNSQRGRACRRAYAHFLMMNQWTLANASDVDKVAALLATANGIQIQRARQVTHPLAVKPAPVRTPQRLSRNRAVRPGLQPPSGPTINVVAENRGWLFEAWKREFASSTCPGFSVAVTDKPLPRSDAWIFVRAREAAATPDPSRTVVQIHDLLDGGRYQSGGERAHVSACAALSLTHPGQEAVLAANGIDISERRRFVQPVGWCTPCDFAAPVAGPPTIAWVGRPAMHDGTEVSRLQWFVDIVRGLAHRPRVALIGERIDGAAATLRRSGLDCRCYSLAQLSPQRATKWLGGFDCVLISGAADSGPWPLFDAIYAGVPVVAAPVGWAARLLADGACGRLADDPVGMTEAVDDVLGDLASWRGRRALMRDRVQPFSMSAWIQGNLALATELARAPYRPISAGPEVLRLGGMK